MENIEQAYKEALEYLYSFVDFSMQKADTYSPERFKLERMVRLAEALGNPHLAYPTIHVAGTKGKGSVCILCATALKEAGYRVGLYTSPHLDDYAERIQINGDFIRHKELVEMVEQIKPQVAAIPELTTFEITTALAFAYFARQKVDTAVIEVGLGGRLDATNVVQPVVSAITSISYDHMHLLGNTITAIAGEKAGIVKAGVPVVSAPQVDEARVVIERVARERGCKLTEIGRDVLFEGVNHSLEGQTIHVWQANGRPPDDITLGIPFLGEHQAANAATAYAILQIYNEGSLKVSRQAVEQGFRSAFWPGRFEIVQQKPAVVLDCAHNRDSAAKLAQTVEQYYPGKKVVLVFGASEDKDIQGMLAELMPMVKTLVAVRSFHPRAIDPDKLVEMAGSYGRDIDCIEDIPQAVERAQQLVGQDGLVLVTGSIFVVAEARKYWEKRSPIRRY